MSEIPDDVREAATSIQCAMHERLVRWEGQRDTMDMLIEDIARAIMAERSRAAEIADRHRGAEEVSETCTIKITMNSDESRHYGEEDIVKQVWPYMQPWFTRRHGAEKGRIEINDVLVIEWKYESTLDAALKDKP